MHHRASAAQALAARLVEGLVLPLLAAEGPVAVSRAAGDAQGGQAALRWQPGGSSSVEEALLDCLAFLAGALQALLVCAVGTFFPLCRQSSFSPVSVASAFHGSRQCTGGKLHVRRGGG